ncbi:MAG: TSUP family transporter [Gammaproteobacteria bacterium]|nr:TSUP family transporter [Gammaproteobacteria bacterium]
MFDWHVYAVFLIAVAAGAYLQAMSGFALGLIVMAIVQATGVMSIENTAAVISVLAFANIALALYFTYQSIDKWLFIGLTIGQIPAIALGLSLLDYLGQESIETLELIFGAFLIIGSLSLVLNPAPRERRSTTITTIGVGAVGGVFGGMFAASGPVVGWFAYQQPIVIASIRASLLAMLGVTTIVRTTYVAIDDIFTISLIWLIVATLPVVLLVTACARRFGPQVSDRQFRRGVFSFVLLIGCWIFGSAVFDFAW